MTDNSVDPKQFGKVAVLFGGISAEREVSLNSGRCVLQGLHDAGIDAHPFDLSERPFIALREEGFVRAFNVLHGGYGENGQIQGALDFFGIRYTGSGVLGSALGFDKFRAKLVWQQLGIPTPPFEIVTRGDDYDAHAQAIVARLGVPLFVKPTHEGSSIAVIKVKTIDVLSAAIAEAVKFDKIVLVEKSIDGGGEYTACIAGDLDLPIIRIVPKGEFYDYAAKYILNTTQYLIPCGLTHKEEMRLKGLACRAFEVLGCTNWGRIDFMMDDAGNPYFLDVNTAPGMTNYSLSPKAARAVGISYRELVVKILSLTMRN